MSYLCFILIGTHVDQCQQTETISDDTETQRR